MDMHTFSRDFCPLKYFYTVHSIEWKWLWSFFKNETWHLPWYCIWLPWYIFVRTVCGHYLSLLNKALFIILCFHTLFIFCTNTQSVEELKCICWSLLGTRKAVFLGGIALPSHTFSLEIVKMSACQSRVFEFSVDRRRHLEDVNMISCHLVMEILHSAWRVRQ